MSKLAEHRDDIITRFTVNRETLRKIADRFGVTYEAVRLFLRSEGVDTSRAAGRQPRQPSAPARRRFERPSGKLRIELPADECGAAHRRHIAAVIKANRGRGFPFLTIRGAL